MSQAKSSRPDNAFEKAVRSVPLLQQGYYRGLRALGKYSSKVHTGDCQVLGSLYLEKAIPDARWDYGIGLGLEHRVFVIWVEVHRADTGEVDKVIEKLKWLKAWLRNEAPELYQMTPENAFYWVSANGVDITSNSAQARRLFSAGLTMPTHVLKVPECK